MILLFLMEQVNRMLKSDKWQTMSDSEGKVFGFRKALKLIVLGVCCHLCCGFFICLHHYLCHHLFITIIIFFQFRMLHAHEFGAPGHVLLDNNDCGMVVMDLNKHA